MMGHCYWILVDGKILEQSRHIMAIKQNPTSFGETEESIKRTFAKHGEENNYNVESKARQEIMLRVIRRGHIRIRKNIHRHCQHWIIQIYELSDERRATISSWAKFVATDGDPYADVIVYQLHDNSKIQTSLNLLGNLK